VSWLQTISERYRVSDDPLRTLRRIELFALLLGAILCLQVALGALRLATSDGPAAVAPAADSLQVPTVLSPALVAAEERNEINARPLFWNSRRPVEVVAMLEESVDKPGKLKDVKLVGLFGSGEQAGIIALVKGKKRRILLGDAVEGWTLKSITQSELVVANGSQTKTLALQRGRVKAAPASKRKAAPRAGQVKPYPTGTAQGDRQEQAGGAASSAPEKGGSDKSAKPEPNRTLSLGSGG